MFDLCNAQKFINLNCFFYENINQFKKFKNSTLTSFDKIEKNVKKNRKKNEIL